MRNHTTKLALLCLLAIMLSPALGGSASAIDVLSYWAFNATGGGNGSTPGSFTNTAPGTTEFYDSSLTTLNFADEGVFKNDSIIDFSNLLGTMGSGTTDTWGTFTGYANNAQPGYIAGYSFAAVGNAGHYVDFNLKSLGYQPQTLSYDTRSSGSGSHDETWTYSVDGGSNWTPMGDWSWTQSDTGNHVASFDLSGIAGISDQADLRFRVTYNSVTGTGGTCRIDNWTVTGSTIGTPTLTWNPSAGANTWDTTTGNWLNGATPATYAPSDVVEFTDAGLANGSTINVTAGLNPGEIHVKNTTGIYSFDNASLSGSGLLEKTGAGAMEFNVANPDFSGIIRVTEGTLNVNRNINGTDDLGTGPLQLNGGSLKKTAVGDTIFAKDIVFSNSSTIDTNGGNLELSGYLTGSYNATAFTKIGDGTLTVSQPDANPPGYFHANVVVQAGTLRVNVVDLAGYTAIGDGGVRVMSGATFQVDNITYGVPSPSGGDTNYFDLYDGGKLLGTGAARMKIGNVNVVANTTGGQNAVEFKTQDASDTLCLLSAVEQFSSNYALPTNATINVGGPGVVKLQSGGISSKYTFGGDWQVNSGILQLGPVDPNPQPTFGAGGYAGPNGEPLNALGFKATTDGTAADPDLPNAVTVNSGAVLAVAVDAANFNLNNTAFPVNPTPNYVRNPVTLNGGSIAATGNEVTYDQTDYNPDPLVTEYSGPQGVDSGTAVVARFGGSFTVAAGTSKVLTYNPSLTTEARTVELVAGTRQVAVGSTTAADPVTGVITYTTDWEGTLQVDAHNTLGGAFNIKRGKDYTGTLAPDEKTMILTEIDLATGGGSVIVGPDARLEILEGAMVDVSGADVFHDTVSDNSVNVDIADNGHFNILNGTHQVGNITGTGAVSVTGDGTAISASGIVADSLTIGGAAPVMAVPEPASLVLLVLAAGIGFVAIRSRRVRG